MRSLMPPWGSFQRRLALFACAASAACGASGSHDKGFVDLQSSAVYPSVNYLSGPGANATDVRVNLDTAEVRVGLGPIDAQSVRRDMLGASEVQSGRDLFEASLVAHYEAMSAPSSPNLGAGGAADAPGELLETEAGGAGLDVDDNSPSPSSMRASDDTTLAVSFPSPKRRVFLAYPAAGVNDAQVNELLAYFEQLASAHGP